MMLARSSEFAGSGDDTRAGLHGGFWADHETRRIYGRLSTHSYVAGGRSQTVTTAQGLWAPYAADYEDIATWLGLQLERRSGLTDAYAGELRERLGERFHGYDAAAGQRLDCTSLFAGKPLGSHLYVCGPQRLLDELKTLAGAHGLRSAMHKTRLTPVRIVRKPALLPLRRGLGQGSVRAGQYRTVTQ